MYFDGSLMKKGTSKYMVRLHFPASNNVAEYDALINALRIAIELGIRRLDI
jgi:ribonuclease HI